jgi:general secretion pathway protein M
MKEWWNNLALREKQMVSLGAVILGALLIYLLLWSPLDNAVSNLRNEIHHNQELLTWMMDADKRLQNLAKSGQPKQPAAVSGSLLSIVQKQINRTSLVSSLSQMHQTDSDSVQLTFQKVEFDKLISWLIELTRDQGITITQMTVTPSPTPGVVAVDLVLKI